MTRRTLFHASALAVASLITRPAQVKATPITRNWDRNPHERRCRDFGCECA